MHSDDLSSIGSLNKSPSRIGPGIKITRPARWLAGASSVEWGVDRARPNRLFLDGEHARGYPAMPRWAPVVSYHRVRRFEASRESRVSYQRMPTALFSEE